MKRCHFAPLALFALAGAIFLLTACGPSNNVRLLTPPPLDATILPAPNAPSVSVVSFEDKRVDTSSIGVRRDGSAFTTNGDVAQWISHVLADELARNGFRVSFAANVNQARSANPDYLVTGQVDEVWLKANSSVEMSSQMRVKLSLANRKGRLWSESCNASQNRSGLPSGATADNLLLDTLRDLVKPMAQKIVQTIDARKN